MRTKYIPLLTALLLVIAVPATSSASNICKHPRLAGLLIRLASPSFDPVTKTDTEIVGGFWSDLKSLKDAAHRGDASLQAYAVTEQHQWIVGYGTADELWATLNAGDYTLRTTLREILKEYHRRKVPPEPQKFLAAEARCRLDVIDTCGCAY